MAAHFSKTILLLGLVTVAVGCTRMSGIDTGVPAPNRTAAAPVNAAPTARVNGGALAPASPTPPAPSTNAATVPAPETPKPVKPEPVEVAKAAPTDGKPVTRQTMVGAWTVSTGGSNCQIFLALTKWSGGYRAASRGCSAAAIADVQAWDVKGKQVVLVNSSGSQAASLYRSADERYDGSTSGGGAISFSR